MSNRTLGSGRGRSTASPIVFKQKRYVRRIGVAAVATVIGGLAPVVATATASAAPASNVAAPAASRTDPDLDVLFIGAHPDDEAFGLATYGQWN